MALKGRAAGPYGVDNGWAIDNNGSPLFTSTVASQMSQGETGWLRIEMRLIPGHTNWDAAMLGYYDTAVNNARTAGIQTLLLIDGGSWPGSQTAWCANNAENNPGTNGDNAYLEGYATNAVAPIVQHFRDRVKYFELWNEPNCWNSNPSPGVFTGCTYMYPSNFGWLLARSWEAVHFTLGIQDVTLFSGGVFGHNIGGVSSYGNAGAQYLDDTYSTGTNVHKGGGFNFTKTNRNAYPLDGIGEHIYLDSGGTVASNTFRQYEEWVHQACAKYEGAGTAKKTFITEFGWQTTNASNPSGVSQAVQDTNLITSFSAIKAAPYVQTSIWFQWKDNPAGGLWYGVLDAANAAKPSYAHYQLFERFEGMYSTGVTNNSITVYYNIRGHSIMGNPFNNGSGAWVYSFLGGDAQDYDGGSHRKLTVMSSTNGTFELNDLHGLWSFYSTNGGSTNFGMALTNEFATGSGTRQDFSRGYLTWDAGNQVVGYAGNLAAPSGLAASPSDSRVGLQWNPVTGAASYNIKRSTTNGGPFLLIANVLATSFTNTFLTNGQVYYYVVNAVGSLGQSLDSIQTSALPIAPPIFTLQPQAQIAGQGGNVTFAASASSAVPPSYQWLWNGAAISRATNTSFSITNVHPASTGNYSIMASNYGGAVTSTNAALAVRPILSVTSGGVFSWEGNYTLQISTNVLGPYLDIPGAISPYTNLNPLVDQQFLRLKK